MKVSDLSLNATIEYIAEITDVREVCLLGTADLAFWKDVLHKEGLYPTIDDGQAQVLITAIESKFLGLRFGELSISMLVCQHEDGATQNGFYLAHAFNSSRLFSFIERAFFHTPYYQANVRVDVRLPALIELSKDGRVIFRAEMSDETVTSSREPSRCGDDGWEGPIFLPGNKPRRNNPGKLFFAKIGGHTQTYPFFSAKDTVTIEPLQSDEILQWLIASHFVPHQWIIRGNARHARSKTIRSVTAGSLQANFRQESTSG